MKNVVYGIYFISTAQLYKGQTEHELSHRIKQHISSKKSWTGSLLRTGHKAIALPLHQIENKDERLKMEENMIKMLKADLNVNNHWVVKRPSTAKELHKRSNHLLRVQKQGNAALNKALKNMAKSAVYELNAWIQSESHTKYERLLDALSSALTKPGEKRFKGAVYIPFLSPNHGGVDSIIRSIKGYPLGIEALAHLRIRPYLKIEQFSSEGNPGINSLKFLDDCVQPAQNSDSPPIENTAKKSSPPPSQTSRNTTKAQCLERLANTH